MRQIMMDEAGETRGRGTGEDGWRERAAQHEAGEGRKEGILGWNGEEKDEGDAGLQGRFPHTFHMQYMY